MRKKCLKLRTRTLLAAGCGICGVYSKFPLSYGSGTIWPLLKCVHAFRLNFVAVQDVTSIYKFFSLLTVIIVVCTHASA